MKQLLAKNLTKIPFKEQNFPHVLVLVVHVLVVVMVIVHQLHRNKKVVLPTKKISPAFNSLVTPQFRES